ncbi:MAG: hypothetical protein K6T90_04880 [Leptolyngbyaceae cyanobacterium HOT.MB2.61]|jgi:hypothetical protein|nr:hypothetical protein [Leptolyngbyaceae cyanobacterium HOT.MB2.61]
MVNNLHTNTQQSGQFTQQSGQFEESPLLSVPTGRYQSQLHHDYADADILRLATFFRSNPNPILVFSPDGNILKTNPAAEKLIKRLQIQESDLLPVDHVQIVQACLGGQMHEYGVEVTTHDHVFALTYHPLPAFKLVYLYAIEITEFKRAEEDLLQIVANTLAMTKQAVSQLRTFRKAQFKPTPRSQPQEPSTEMFVAMDGCVFVSGDRLGEWD